MFVIYEIINDNGKAPKHKSPIKIPKIEYICIADTYTNQPTKRNNKKNVSTEQENPFCVGGISTPDDCLPE